MKTDGVLLMLLCSCMAQTQFTAEAISNNVMQGPGTEETKPQEFMDDAAQRSGAAAAAPTAASSQHTCQPDIHTVLREMAILITEQTVELQSTKSQLEAVERAAEAMKDRLIVCEKTMEEQRVELMHTKTQLEAMEKKAEDMESRLITSQAKHLNLTMRAVSDLRRERDQNRVSFSASQLKDGVADIGPSAVDAPLVFRNIITNIGNAYSPNTGVFTAPMRGVYFFTVFVYGHGHPSRTTGVTLWKNEEHIFLAYAAQQQGATPTSNGASLLLEVGDEVYLKLWTGAWVRDSYNHHNFFSGHLLFPW